jgi:hypothetical protein
LILWENLGKTTRNTLYYHPHLFDSEISDFTNKLLHGSVPAEDLLNLINWNTEKMKAIKIFHELHPEIDDEIALRVAPTALQLAKENDWILIGDDPSMPVPLFSEKVKDVKSLSSILAEECIKIVIPKCNAISDEDILEMRDKLKNLLIPFRMGMQKLSLTLKIAIRNKSDFNEIKSEAIFISQSIVEPALFEIRRKLELEKEKLWLRVFGSVVSWIPFIAKAYATTSPNQIYKAILKIYGDVSSMTQSINEIKFNNEPGLSFLLSIEQELKDKNMNANII